MMRISTDNLVNRLHSNPKHELASNSPFMLRMLLKADDMPEKMDVVNLFTQYIPLYQAMENRLTELTRKNTQNYLNIFCKEPWLSRSQLIEQDIAEMIRYVSDEDQYQLLPINYEFPATKVMTSTVEKADPLQLFTYLSVRCLADSYGGQALNRNTQKIFGEHDLSTQFYKSASRQARTLGEEVNSLSFSEEEEQQLFKLADDFFQTHIELFEQMERVRNRTGEVK